MNKIVVITGGTSGIGLELKKLFEANGDTVLTVSKRELSDENHYSCDMRNELKVKQVINGIGQKFGRIDLLINSAGLGMSGITELVPTDDIIKLTEVDYFGVLYTIRSAIRFMSEGSRIVNISSAMALFPVPFRSIYGSLKSAVLSLSYSLRMELKPMGIDVVAICPGDIKTNFTENRIKNFETSERYGDRLSTATEKSDSRENKRMSAEKCALAIYKKLFKNKCKPMYIIGGKYKFLHFLTRITPKSWLLGITGKIYGGQFVAKVKNTKPVDSAPIPQSNETPRQPIVQEPIVETEKKEEPVVVEQAQEEVKEEKVEQPKEQPKEEKKPAKKEESTSGLFKMINKMKK